jgi:oligopeptide/dipeptide ABC transporter ATP-binding protein
MLLEVEDLVTEFSDASGSWRAVDGVSFALDRGQTLGIVGESGSGKTITALSIVKLLPKGARVASGRVRFDGEDLCSADENRMRRIRGRKIGFVFQDPLSSLNPSKTIGFQIGETLTIHGLARAKEANDRVVELLEMVGIADASRRLDDYPHQLSGGMRQRIMIASALAAGPQLLIADEPTTALDVTIQAQILALLDSLRERLGMAMILVTHDLGVIAGRTDQVMVMYAGKAVEQCPTEELFHAMRHPYTQALMAAIPRIGDDPSRPLAAIEGLPPDLTRQISGCRFEPRCKLAKVRCKQEEPELVSFGDEHKVACFYPIEPVNIGFSKGAGRRELSGSPTILDARQLVKEFPVYRGMFRKKVGTVRAVDGITFSVARGETFAIVGESGCGKTTLGRMLVALEEPTSGTVELDGIPISELGPKDLRRCRRNFQMMFQDPYASLDPTMNVEAIVTEPLDAQHIGTARERRERAIALLREVGLREETLDRYPHEFSGGQRQRIGLARALAPEPKLLVADEPVSALDVSIRSQVLNLLKQIQQRRQLSLVIISHDLSIVSYLADRVGVMYLGRMVEVARTDELFGNPAHPYTRALLRSVPIPDPTHEKAKRGRIPVVGELPSPLDPPSGCSFRTRCPYADAICSEETPRIQAITDGHLVACHKSEMVTSTPWSLADVGAQLT